MHAPLCYDALQNPTNRPLTNPFVASPRAEFMAKDRRPGTFRIDHPEVSDSSELGTDADHVPTEAMPAAGLGVDLPVTQLLLDWRQGDAQALEQLAPVVYNELRRLARGFMRGERAGHVLQTTALVHEAYLKLIDLELDWQDRVHFYSVAARLMRRVLVDFARERNADKRGGGMAPLELDEALVGHERLDTTVDLIALDQALEQLAKVDERKVKVIEMRSFAGLTIDEVAEVLGVSHATVERDLSFARAFLTRRLTGGHG